MRDELSAHSVREMLDYAPETGLLTWKPKKGRGARNDLAGTVAGSPHKDGYLAVQIGRQKYLAHRIVWLIATGAWPKGEIDHVNRQRDDNRLENLRDTDRSGNQQNRSNVSGVDFVKRTNKWRARITLRGKVIGLGNYASQHEALEAYKTAKGLVHA